MTRSARFALAAVTLACSPAFAHERLLSPAPRANMEDNQKVAPCGNLPRSTTPYQVKPGASLPVTWMQTIHHPGWFRISFRTSETGDFTQDVLVDKVLSVDNVDNGNATVQLPNMACDTCTLHLAQIMTDQPDATFATGYKEYNACADLILTDNPVNAPAGTTGGTDGTTGSAGTAASTSGGSTGGTPASVDTEAGKMPSGGCSAVDPSPFMLLGALCVFAVWRRRAA